MKRGKSEGALTSNGKFVLTGRVTKASAINFKLLIRNKEELKETVLKGAGGAL